MARSWLNILGHLLLWSTATNDLQVLLLIFDGLVRQNGLCNWDFCLQLCADHETGKICPVLMIPSSLAPAYLPSTEGTLGLENGIYATDPNVFEHK